MTKINIIIEISKGCPLYFLKINFLEKKLQILFFIYQILLVSASGDAPISIPYLAKKSWLKSKIWNMQMFLAFLYLFNTLLHGTKKEASFKKPLNLE